MFFVIFVVVVVVDDDDVVSFLFVSLFVCFFVFTSAISVQRYYQANWERSLRGFVIYPCE